SLPLSGPLHVLIWLPFGSITTNGLIDRFLATCFDQTFVTFGVWRGGLKLVPTDLAFPSLRAQSGGGNLRPTTIKPHPEDIAMTMHQRQRILIWGKTRPELSRTYRETVCTGGILADNRRLIRLYPIPLR